MRSILLLLPLLAVCSIVLAQENVRINGNFKGLSLEKVIEKLESQTRLKFYYEHGIADSLYVDIEAHDEKREDFLTRLLKPGELQFAIDDQDNVYITRDRKIAVSLPTDFFYDDNSDTARTSGFDFSLYENLAPKKKLLESKLYTIGSITTNLSGKATLAGHVRDMATGEPIVGATVYIEHPLTGIATDQFGYYSILLPKGRNELKIKNVGLKSTVRQILLYSDGKLDVELEQDVTPLKEVVIESQAESRVNAVQMGVEKLDIGQMKQIPLALGETDVMKVVMALPGVQTVGEGTVGINVRGGATNQNLILLNDAVVYNPSHLFGFFSAFNPDVIRNVELYKSGIKAEFGGRLSSVLDVRTKEGNMKKISGSGGVSPVTVRLSVEGPVAGDKTSFVVGARTTYSNWLLRQLKDPDLKRSRAAFHDLTANVTHILGENDNLYLSGYFSKDQFNLATDTSYEYGDKNASLKWKHLFNNRLVGVLTATMSEYDSKMSSVKNPSRAFDLAFTVKQLNAKADFTFFANSKHTFDGGAHIVRYDLSPGRFTPSGNESLIKSDVVEDEQGIESALYLSDQLEVSSKLSVYAGLRYSLYRFLGPKHLSFYDENFARDTVYITRTVRYSSGTTIATYSGPEPRLSVRYAISGNLSLKLSYNKMRQYIQMLSNTTAITPTDIWKLSDRYIRPQVGEQLSAGIYKNIHGKNLIEVSVEGYYKKLENTIDYKNGSVLLLNHHLETDVLNATGRAYGLEVLIKKNTGKINGWFSYAYSRSFLKTKSRFDSETVNRGKWYPSNFDKPHAVNFIGNYKFSRRFNFSLNVIYSTGRPITLPIVKYDVGTTSRVLYSDRNAFRIPDYFRTDVSLNFEGNHKVKKLANSSWTFAVYNLTGRKNAYSVFFVTSNSQVKGYKLSIFAQPIPTITYNFRF